MNFIKKTAQDIAFYLATFGLVKDERPDGNTLYLEFLSRCRQMDAPRVLELGTKRSIHSRSTLHREWVPNAGEFLGTDIEPGVDVDFVADVHQLSSVTGEEQFDVIISSSSFEHFKYPHKAAHELMKALRVGGVLFAHTHHSLPIHAFPYDYFRFTREGLAGLFGTKMGFNVIATDYEYPVRLFSKNDRYGHFSPAFLNVRLFGEKLNQTPNDYIYELDTE